MEKMLIASIEALLLVSNRPLRVKELSQVCAASTAEVENALASLKKKYQTEYSGIAIVLADDTVQFMTVPAVKSVVEQFVKTETVGELTRPQLETLTIIAYRGPIIKDDLERLRGVNCTLVLRNLMLRGLVEAKEDVRSRITAYAVTVEFLRHLGVRSVEEFPEYATLSRDEKIDQLLSQPIPDSVREGKSTESTDIPTSV